MSVLKRTGRWVIGLSPVIAVFTAHGLAVLLVLAVLVFVLAILGRGMFRWLVVSEERSGRVIRDRAAERRQGNARSILPAARASGYSHPK